MASAIAATVVGAWSEVHFTLPVVPGDLREPAQRADYVCRHYWDSVDWHKVNPSDSLDRRSVEEALADYATILPLLPDTARREVAGEWLGKVRQSGEDTWRMALSLARQYLYEPASPVFSLDLYDAVAEAAAGLAPEDERLALESEELSHGRPGTKAGDFGMTTRDGEVSTLHAAIESLGDKEEILVIFYSPDCEDCHRLMMTLANAPSQATQKIGVVAVYAWEDEERWRQDAQLWPPEWIVARSTEGDDIPYVIRRTPTVYTLDPQGRILSRQ